MCENLKAGKNAIGVCKEPGDHYEAMVPDTLDLSQMARLAINALTRTLDPARDYEMYFVSEFQQNPPRLYHDWCGIFLAGKYLECLPLMRVMSGSSYNIDIDGKLMESYMHGIGADGLYYAPTEARPWCWSIQTGDRVPDVWAPLVGGQAVGYQAGWKGTEIQGSYGFFYTEGRAISALCRWYQHDKNPMWKMLIEKKIDRLLQLGYKNGDAIDFSRFFVPDQQGPNGEPTYGLDAQVPFGPIKFYQLTGYKPALELARGQAESHMKSLSEDGTFAGRHFHCTIVQFINILEYGVVTGDEKLIQLAKNAYDYGKSIGTPLVGFFGEAALAEHRTCEGCTVADMVLLALKLTQAGAGDYWDDVDRYVRNQFSEMQLKSAGQVDFEKLARDLEPGARAKVEREANAAEQWPGLCDDTDAAERSVGSWAGWSLGNDFNNPSVESGIMQCCTGNGARTLYFIWHSIVTTGCKTVKVNLLLNRASPWLDVNSYIPYEGRVDIEIKRRCELEVRIPEWVMPEQTGCSVNGTDRRLTFCGRYAQAGEVKEGDLVVLTFPISERVVNTVIGAVPYRLIIKGNDVVYIDPPGKWSPFYQRAHYRENQVRWVKRQRFVADEVIE